MRLALSTRIILWIARREEQALHTTAENVYDYWVNQPGVTRDAVTAVLKSVMVGRTIGTLGGLWYLGDKAGRLFEALWFHYVKKPRRIKEQLENFRVATIGNDHTLQVISAEEIRFLTGQYPEGYTPQHLKTTQEIVAEQFERAGFHQEEKP